MFVLFITHTYYISFSLRIPPALNAVRSPTIRSQNDAITFNVSFNNLVWFGDESILYIRFLLDFTSFVELVQNRQKKNIVMQWKPYHIKYNAKP